MVYVLHTSKLFAALTKHCTDLSHLIKHACRSKVDIFIAREGYSSFQERDVSSWFFFPLVNKIDRNTRDEEKMLNYKHCSRTHTATKQKCQTGILRSAKLFQLFHIYDFLISTIIIRHLDGSFGSNIMTSSQLAC